MVEQELVEQFDSGAEKESNHGKLQYSLIPLEPLKRLALRYQLGEEKYPNGNYKKGLPYSRVYDSLLRHLFQWREGSRNEDHLAAVAWGAFTLMYYEEMLSKGILPGELEDLWN